jgi:IS5 family transposase
VFENSGCFGVERREAEKIFQVNWHVAMMSERNRAVNLEAASVHLRDAPMKVKAGIWAKVEHLFRVIKFEFGFTKGQNFGLAEYTARLHTLFLVSDL